jgi:two-component system, OmpR family, sensor histidine kinase CiaH
MFRGALFRLAAQYFVLLALILGFLDVIVYVTVSGALWGRTEQALASAVKQASSDVSVFGDTVSVNAQVLLDPSLADSYMWVYQLSNNQTVLPNQTTSSLFNDSTLDPAKAQAKQGKTTETRVTLDNNVFNSNQFIVNTQPLIDKKKHKVVGILQVAQPISWVNEALSRLILQLIEASAVGLVLGALASLLMATRSLRPIIRALDRQRAFVADASHELRTPLTLIRTNVDAWLRRAKSENRAYARSIIEEVEHLNRIVGDLTTLALADSRQLRIEPKPIELNRMVTDLMQQALPMAEERGISLKPELNGGATVEADPARVRQLLLILIDNALEHTPAGGVVSVGVESRNGDACITVRDTGEGIPSSDLPHLFERFYRADKARSRESGGTGLGLAIAKWIVDAHKGEIAINSTVGKGTEVSVSLPAVT